MITQIGLVAGDIWHYLDKHGEVKFDDLLKGVEKERDIVLMSLGWLAREGHVIVGNDKSGRLVKLRKEQ